jgi:hypothetical protein
MSERGGIAFLPVGCYGVVYHRLDAAIKKVTAQTVTMFCEDGELMIYVASIRQPVRQGDMRIADGVIIDGCYLLAMVIVILKVSQLYAQHGGINFRNAAVAPHVAEDVLLLCAIVGK